ncbi:GMC family oxidoreductase [Falsiroseomonas sp. HW251]|uniref:GMC family oxidoreductase n=1 Tax=Falsiroseomonas sp. HW251 TaxID=3390998 RepID=UPI003D310282
MAGRIIHDTRVMWRFFTEPEAEAGERRLYWPRGRVLGGSSAVNGMLWVRGDPARYDEIASTGCPGWDWSAIEPVMRRIEDWPEGDPAWRGRGGPVSIQEIARKDPMSLAFLQACAASGVPRTPDYNGPRFEGAACLQMCTRRGERVSAADAYLKSLEGRAGVDLRLGAVVKRVLFEGRRAVGVELVRDGVREVSRCGGDVVLAAGSVQSPQILELSGIGDAVRLQALGVPLVHTAPGVGENLQDHFHVRITYHAQGVVTVNDLMRRPWLYGPPAWLEYRLRRTGLFANVASTAHALVRSTPDQPKPDLKIQIHKISAPDRMGTTRGSGLDPFSGISIGLFPIYPESRGSVHAATPRIEDPPRIRANYLSAKADRLRTVLGMRMARTIAGQPALRRFLVEETRPGPASDSDEALLAHARRIGQTSYHPVGTCRMGTDAAAVTDPLLRVRGVSNLRVADASVFPLMPSPNTNAPAIMVGERAADFILGRRTA